MKRDQQEAYTLHLMQLFLYIVLHLFYIQTGYIDLKLDVVII